MLINKDHLFSAIWAFIVVAGLLYNSMFGSLSILAFLVAGLVFVMSNLFTTYDYCKKHWILFLIPFWALLSALWSDISMVAARGSVQLILTTVFAVVIASKVNIDTLLKAIGVAMLLAMLMSLLSSRTTLNGLTGEVSLIGIFHSKNFLATNTAMSICIALTLVFDQYTDKSSRLLGVLLLVISLLVLFKAKSFGAVVFIALTVIFSSTIVFYQNLRLHMSTRRFINRCVITLFIVTLILVIMSLTVGYFDEFMYSIGKSPTLTGRTVIWERGIEVIENNPILGVGYQSFFYIGNEGAEDIWEFAHVTSGAGFNFHNMYVDVAVELGTVGLLLFILLICAFFKRILSITDIRFGSQHYFSILVFIFLFLQTFLEAGWLNQFTITHLFICLAWVYLQENKVYVSE